MKNCTKDKKIGQEFGNWTVLKLLEERTKHGQKRYLCKCKCGAEGVVTGSNLSTAQKKTNPRCWECRQIAVEIGKRYGAWTVLSKVPGKKQTTALCRCECGNEKQVRYHTLTDGESTRCQDCQWDGSKSHPLYSTWIGIKSRCYNPKEPGYKWYGARGITVCDRWLNSFHAFVEDMGQKPSPKHSIDRLDNEKGYSPENCVWATNHQQCANRRTTSVRCGVNWKKKGWYAQIQVNKEIYYLGYFKNLEDAIQARRDAEVQHLGYTLD